MQKFPAIDERIIAEVSLKHHIEPHSIDRYPSGQINRVYNINNDFVLKIEGELSYAKGIFSVQKEISETLCSRGAKVGRVLDAGRFEDKGYLFMEKLPGKNLVYDWQNFTDQQKENYIEQLVGQLRIFHSVRFDRYAIPVYQGRTFANLGEAIARTIDFSRLDMTRLPDDMRDAVEYLQMWYAEHASMLEETGTAVFVHNDVHLENILHAEGQISGIIDLDWWCQAPREYELRKLMDYFHTPARCVEEKLEAQYANQMVQEAALLRKHYPELFDSPQLADRVRLYYLEDMLDVLSDYQAGRWGERVLDDVRHKFKDFYKGSWLADQL